jgi:biopolymer transport protein ExbD
MSKPIEDADVKSEPNVVPMIDVMLVLLIIFMIVTPIITAGFQAEMPEAKNIEKAEEEDGDVVLGIDDAGLLYLDPGTGEIGPVQRADLQAIWSDAPPRDAPQDEKLSFWLTKVYENRTNKIMYFRADQDLEFSYVEDAMDVARKSGVRVLAAVTEEQRPGAGRRR